MGLRYLVSLEKEKGDVCWEVGVGTLTRTWGRGRGVEGSRGVCSILGIQPHVKGAKLSLAFTSTF